MKNESDPLPVAGERRAPLVRLDRELIVPTIVDRLYAAIRREVVGLCPATVKDLLANELYAVREQAESAASSPAGGEFGQCQECGCTTGGGDYCWQHRPYTVYPLKDGTWRNGSFPR